MRVNAANIWIVLCVLAQMFCSTMPQGAQFCVRPFIAQGGSRPMTDSAAPSDDCCSDLCCCSDELTGGTTNDGEQSPSQLPLRGPCREHDCTLCVRAFDSLPPARGGTHLDDATELVAWLALPIAGTTDLTEPSLAQFERPPPLPPWRSSCGLVGTVILLV